MRLRGLASIGVVVLLAMALELVCRCGLVQPTTMPPPSAMVASLIAILRSGAYDHAMLLTFGEVLSSAAIAVGAGFALGTGLHASGMARVAVEPYLASYYAVPTFIFYPVFIVLFGVGSGAIVAIASLLAIVAMITATLNGLDQLPRVLGRTAKVMRLSRMQTAILVQLPAAAPSLLTGARLAVAYSFIGVIASEFILSGDGIGYSIAYAYNNFDNRTMYGLMLLVIVVVTAVNAVLDAVDRRFQSRFVR